MLREKKQEILWIEGLMREWERKKEGDKHVMDNKDESIEETYSEISFEIGP